MVVIDEDFPQDTDEHRANARLIAAAPRMYAVLVATQAALAAWRDGEPIMHDGREINLEEFKYLVVDPILQHNPAEVQANDSDSDSDNASDDPGYCEG